MDVQDNAVIQEDGNAIFSVTAQNPARLRFTANDLCADLAVKVKPIAEEGKSLGTKHRK